VYLLITSRLDVSEPRNRAPPEAVSAAPRSRTHYPQCIVLDKTKPMNIVVLAIRTAIAFSVHLTNAKAYSPGSGW